MKIMFPPYFSTFKWYLFCMLGMELNNNSNNFHLLTYKHLMLVAVGEAVDVETLHNEDKVEEGIGEAEEQTGVDVATDEAEEEMVVDEEE